MTTLTGPERLGRDELTTIERIRAAALRSFATHGSSETSLRSVAAAAGVSLKLVRTAPERTQALEPDRLRRCLHGLPRCGGQRHRAQHPGVQKVSAPRRSAAC
jgi:hypothetical protein